MFPQSQIRQQLRDKSGAPGQGTHTDAGWGFGQGWGWRTGSLNLDHGYYVNTAVSITGRVVALGSKARDEDGTTYILPQKVTNRTTGAKAVLRGETGKPAWAGGGRHGRGSSRGSQ